MALDATAAWLPYEPSDQRPWNRRLAAHLFRRAGFAATSAELDQAVKDGPREAVQKLLAAESPQFASEMHTFASTLLAGGKAEALSAWWAYCMLHTPAPLLEKLTLFWHGHFATSAAKVLDPQLMYQQNQLLRKHALGSFEELVQGISRDPAMLIYLDSVTNKKSHPNENYAREVMELFCLGLGNYSERDVQELARCFTGWEIQRGEFKFNRFQHDFGQKKMLGASGDFDGTDGIKVILAQQAAPQFLCTKLVRYFVTDEAELSAEFIAPLAKQFREQNLTIAPVVETILTSRYFYSDESVGKKIRSPVELGIGLLRALSGTASTQRLAQELGDLGQKLFYPPNVKGWDGGTAWINSATLLGRANLVKHLLEDPNAKFGGGTLVQFCETQGWQNSQAIVDGLCELLLASELAPKVRQQLVEGLEREQKQRHQALRKAIYTLAALPEYQIG